MYPGYRAEHVLNDYSSRFFLLLEQGYRIKSLEYMRLAQIAMAPEAKPQSWKSFIKKLEWDTKDISDMINPDVDETNPAALKKLFG